MPQIVCPYCFNKFKRSEVMFRCGNNSSGCSSEEDPTMTQFWGNMQKVGHPIEAHPSFMQRMLDKMPDSAVCDKCGTEQHRIICPNCHNPVPKRMVENKGFIISIIGARSSGKTNYITVLIEQLRKFGWTLDVGFLADDTPDDPKNRTQERYRNDFYRVLYEQGKCPLQTDIKDPKSRVPLIYSLTRGDDFVYLVFYDTAGENFNDIRNVRDNAQFLKQTDATIYLLDTFAIDDVYRRLKGKLGLKPAELSYDKILATINSFFTEECDKNTREEFLKKPMALAFSKIDAVLSNVNEFQDAMPSNMDLSQNSSFLDGSGINANEFDSISAGMMGALAAWGEQTFLKTMEMYKRHKYFGISALGKAPDTDNKIDRVRPYRVLDPLVWILDELGFKLPKTK